MTSSLNNRVPFLSPLAHPAERLRTSNGCLSFRFSMLAIAAASLLLWAVMAAAIYELVEVL